MMTFAIANVPQVYDECDHNVMRLAPLHGCRAQSARCADKQRTIGAQLTDVSIRLEK